MKCEYLHEVDEECYEMQVRNDKIIEDKTFYKYN